MKRKEMAPPEDSRKTSYLIVSPIQTITQGEEISIRGEGRFTFKYGWNGIEGTFWGPVNGKHQSWRTFRTDQITRVHRKKAAHGTL